jgi:hypothetical protein
VRGVAPSYGLALRLQGWEPPRGRLPFRCRVVGLGACQAYALASRIAEGDVRKAGGVADLCGRVVVRAGEIALYDVGVDLVAIGIEGGVSWYLTLPLTLVRKKPSQQVCISATLTLPPTDVSSNVA